MNDQSMAQNEIMYPLQEREANQVLDINTQTIDSNRANQYFKSVADVKPSLDPLIQAGDVDVRSMSVTMGAQLNVQDGEWHG